jgi:hypothetical protein
MGQVIELRRARMVRQPVPNAPYGCTRCGAELWNLFADGRVRCADCEQECPLRTVGLNVSGHDTTPNEQSNNRE